MMPSPSDLSYFMEVALTLNISRASERLGISQPTLTLSIQRLEQNVGTPLFIRSKKGVTLTQAGKQLFVHARTLLDQWDTIRNQTLASSTEIQGSYTLGCHPSVALYSLPVMMANFLDKNPHIDLKLSHSLSRKITEQVIQSRVDIGIAVNPTKHPDLVIRKLCDDEVTLWVGTGSRKIQRYNTEEMLLICDPELMQTQSILKKLKTQKIKYGRILESSNLEVIRDLVAHGAGIGILPSRVAMNSGFNSLHRIKKAPSYKDEICLLYRVENKHVRSIQSITEAICATLK